DGLALRDAEFRKAAVSWLHPRSSAEVRVGDHVVGVLGELHPQVADAFELPREVFVAELEVDALLNAAQLAPRFQGIPKFPGSLRDIAVVVEDRVTAADVRAEIIKADAQKLVEDVLLFDVYSGEKVPQGKKNLAFSIRYRSAARTLTDDEVNTVHAAVVERL